MEIGKVRIVEVFVRTAAFGQNMLPLGAEHDPPNYLLLSQNSKFRVPDGLQGLRYYCNMLFAVGLRWGMTSSG